ncbi:hypothetical protein [Borreliella burgdorferi]|uniref:hypothetical protein n=1 Tax=Borreliella burgdorferi TaxID=139 RepID=UPI000BC35703
MLFKQRTKTIHFKEKILIMVNASFPKKSKRNSNIIKLASINILKKFKNLGFHVNKSIHSYKNSLISNLKI